MFCLSIQNSQDLSELYEKFAFEIKNVSKPYDQVKEFIAISISHSSTNNSIFHYLGLWKVSSAVREILVQCFNSLKYSPCISLD